MGRIRISTAGDRGQPWDAKFRFLRRRLAALTARHWLAPSRSGGSSPRATVAGYRFHFGGGTKRVIDDIWIEIVRNPRTESGRERESSNEPHRSTEVSNPTFQSFGALRREEAARKLCPAEHGSVQAQFIVATLGQLHFIEFAAVDGGDIAVTVAVAVERKWPLVHSSISRAARRSRLVRLSSAIGRDEPTVSSNVTHEVSLSVCVCVVLQRPVQNPLASGCCDDLPLGPSGRTWPCVADHGTASAGGAFGGRRAQKGEQGASGCCRCWSSRLELSWRRIKFPLELSPADERCPFRWRAPSLDRGAQKAHLSALATKSAVLRPLQATGGPGPHANSPTASRLQLRPQLTIMIMNRVNGRELGPALEAANKTSGRRLFPFPLAQLRGGLLSDDRLAQRSRRRRRRH